MTFYTEIIQFVQFIQFLIQFTSATSTMTIPKLSKKPILSFLMNNGEMNQVREPIHSP